MSNNNILSNNKLKLVFAPKVSAEFNAFIGEVNVDAAANFQFDSLVSLGDISPSGFVDLSFSTLSVASSIMSSIQQRKQMEFISKQFSLMNAKLDHVIAKLNLLGTELTQIGSKLDAISIKLESLEVSVEESPYRAVMVRLNGDMLEFTENLQAWARNPQTHIEDIGRLRQSIKRAHFEMRASSCPVGIHSLALSLPIYATLCDLGEISGELTTEQRDQMISDATARLISHFEAQLTSNGSNRGTLEAKDNLATRAQILQNRINAILPISNVAPDVGGIDGAPQGSIWKVRLEDHEFLAKLNTEKLYVYRGRRSPDGLEFGDRHNTPHWHGSYFKFRGQNFVIDGPVDVYGVYSFSDNKLVFRDSFYFPTLDSEVIKPALPKREYGSCEMLDERLHVSSTYSWLKHFKPIFTVPKNQRRPLTPHINASSLTNSNSMQSSAARPAAKLLNSKAGLNELSEHLNNYIDTVASILVLEQHVVELKNIQKNLKKQ